MRCAWGHVRWRGSPGARVVRVGLMEAPRGTPEEEEEMTEKKVGAAVQRTGRNRV